MEIRTEHAPWKHRELLLLGDEDEKMIARYLDCGTMYVLSERGVRAEIVLTEETPSSLGVPKDSGQSGERVLEIKNLAVHPGFQRRGYGRALIEFVCGTYQGRFPWVYVGTGESPLTLPFYEACGFVYSHRIEHFFRDNYPRPIEEAGVILDDMVYLKRKL